MRYNLQDLRQNCLILINYLKERGGGEMMNQFSIIVEQSYNNEDKKGLTLLLKDLTEWVSGLLNYKKRDSNQLINKLIDEYESKVLKILEIRKIYTDEEYTLLYNYLNQNFGEIEEGIITEINKILLEYDTSL